MKRYLPQGPNIHRCIRLKLHDAGSRLMTFNTGSRLRNQMHLVASLLGIATSYPEGVWTVCVDPDLYICHVFPVVVALPTCRLETGNFIRSYKRNDGRKCCHYYQEFCGIFLQTCMCSLSTTSCSRRSIFLTFPITFVVSSGSVHRSKIAQRRCSKEP